VNNYTVIPRLLRILLATLLLVSFQVSAEVIKVPGTTLLMTPPAGFTLSKDFTGFENRQTKSSIMIVEFPKSSYSELAALFLDINLAQENFSPIGVSVLGQKNIVLTANKATVLFLSGIQAYKDKEVGKYLALVEGDKTVLISFNIFDETVSHENIIIESVKSIRLED